MLKMTKRSLNSLMMKKTSKPYGELYAPHSFIKEEIKMKKNGKPVSMLGDEDNTQKQKTIDFVTNVLSHINDDVNEQSDDYEIKVTGDERTFEDGFVRYTKEGKGRYDLIPFEVIGDNISMMENLYIRTQAIHQTNLVAFSNFMIIEAISKLDLQAAIANITAMHYCNKNKVSTIRISRDSYSDGLIKMLKDLSIHFEKGAAKYGENNWRKGVNELWSFIDSGRRHTMQYLNGETDEPHHISAIWNFVCYLALTREEPDNGPTDLGTMFTKRDSIQ